MILDAEGPLDVAGERLARAVATLESKIAALAAERDAAEAPTEARPGAPGEPDDAVDGDLVVELEAARAREVALTAAAAEASAVLGRAAERIGAALAEPGLAEPAAAEPREV